jgi:hypothetical protein
MPFVKLYGWPLAGIKAALFLPAAGGLLLLPLYYVRRIMVGGIMISS